MSKLKADIEPFDDDCAVELRLVDRSANKQARAIGLGTDLLDPELAVDLNFADRLVGVGLTFNEIFLFDIANSRYVAEVG